MVGTIAAALFLAGCAGTGEAGRTTTSASPAASEKSPSAVSRTLDQVLSDLHLASRDVGEYRVRILADEDRVTQQLPLCQADGVVWTRTVPGRAEILKITEQLRLKGWVIDDQDLIEATSGTWTIMFRSAPLPKELVAKACRTKA
ncbi:hypothetical protein WJ438_40315 [Streptomyces sp. GD-15H]|uniref:hypothetical protein n=1 Tax=Streptomyces sp. GD-15H TaxID=3129112 RepID=UPI003244A533